MCSSVWILVLTLVMVITQINARGWQHSIQSSFRKTKQTSISFVHSSKPISEDLTTKKHTTILEIIKKRPALTIIEPLIQTTLIPEVATTHDVIVSKTTTLPSRYKLGHTIVAPSSKPETTTISIARRIDEFMTLHAVKVTKGFIPRREAKSTVRQTMNRETRLALIQVLTFTPINLPRYTPGPERPALGQTTKQETRSVFSRTPAISTTLGSKLTSAPTAIHLLEQTLETASAVPRRIPEIPTLHALKLKFGLTTGPILGARRISEQTKRKSEFTNTHILRQSFKLTTRVDIEPTSGFTTTLSPKIATKSDLKQVISVSKIPESGKNLEFVTKSASKIRPGLGTASEFRISPKPSIKRTLKSTATNITKFNRTPRFTTRLAPKLNPGARNGPRLTNARRPTSITPIRQTSRLATRSANIQTPGHIIPHITKEKSRFIARIITTTITLPVYSRLHSHVTKAATSWVPRYESRSSPKEIPRHITKTTFSQTPAITYRHSSKFTTRSTHKKVTSTTETAFGLSSRLIKRHLPNTTRYTDRLATRPTSKLTSESAPRKTIKPSTRNKLTLPETRNRSVETSQISGSESSEEFKFTPGSKSLKKTGFTQLFTTGFTTGFNKSLRTTGLRANSTTTQKNINTQLWVGVWRPWFTQDANPGQDFELGFTEDFKPGYRSGRIRDVNSDITPSTISQLFIDEILKLIEKLDQTLRL